MKRSVEAAELESAVRALFIYMEDLDDKDQMSRDEVRQLVCKISEAYLNWAFELDNARISLVK
jgi:hypothetical protein